MRFESAFCDECPRQGKCFTYGYESECSQNNGVKIVCDHCGRDITFEDVYRDENYEDLCMDCLLDEHLVDDC